MRLFSLLHIVGHTLTNTHMGSRQLAKKTAIIIEFWKVNIFKCVYVMISTKNASSPIRCTWRKWGWGSLLRSSEGKMNEWITEMIIWTYNLNLPWRKSQKFYLYLPISQPMRREMKNVVASLYHLDSKKKIT